MKSRFVQLIFLVCILFEADVCVGQSSDENAAWPEVTNESKPWTRWWWHGSAVTKEGITEELERISGAGFGGVEITPIYGTLGHEENFISFLSQAWIEVLLHTLKEAQRLELGVDMATGTGWPFGGPWVDDEDACRYVKLKSYEVSTAEEIPEKIEYIQEPLLRRVGFNIPGVSHVADDDDLSRLKDPIGRNSDLQVLAIDQVRFQKPLPLKALMAYDTKGKSIDLTAQVTHDGKLEWRYPGGRWTLIAVFAGWHGKMVERAGPGGEGNVIDHFSAGALDRYLSRFDSAFRNADLRSLRAFFNDSYEVDDAYGSADWTPDLLSEFRKRRRYDLKDYLYQLAREKPNDTTHRILCDYRETLSDLLLENFTTRWRDWGHSHGALVRNQAHGSPANILDLYAAVDIPEIEGEEPLRIKMASSAGNVSGKKLIAAEAATWMDEHFQSNLGEVKFALDRFMLNGVNHLVYHGTAYSPATEAWPGWLFYAAVHFNNRNPLWQDLSALNQYVARCQSFLQNTTPDNDVLLYYPVYDLFSRPGPEMIEHFDGIGKQFEGTPFARVAGGLYEAGHSFDFISDRQINELQVTGGLLRTSGNALYKTLIVPRCKYIPAKTLSQILAMVQQGARVVFSDGLPDSFSGFANLKRNATTFRQDKKVLASLRFEESPSQIILGKGKALGGSNLANLMTAIGVKAEGLKEKKIYFIRKRTSDDIVYFITNRGDTRFRGEVTLSRSARSIEAYDPMTGESGKLSLTSSPDSGTTISLDLAINQSLILRLSQKTSEALPFPLYHAVAGEIGLPGPWSLEFIEGGPEIPATVTLDSLISWTEIGKDYSHYSGSARYRHEFRRPEARADAWRIELGEVKESAAVYINGTYAGTCIGPDYAIRLSDNLLKDNNTLEVIVSNSMANRIRYMDKQKIPWKKFYNINFPARKPANARDGLFDASSWAPVPSGLLGPVQLIPLKNAIAP